MEKQTEVKCPKCGQEAKFPSADAMLDYTVNDGIFYWECFECNYKWKGDYLGKKLREKI
jgi:C4-type Zn-finger protein